MVASSKGKVSLFSLKVHRIEGEIIVAVCDIEILGTTISEDDLEVEISPRFYGGPNIGWDKALDYIKKASIVNIIGNRIVDKSLEKGLVNEEGVKSIGGIRHAQIILV